MATLDIIAVLGVVGSVASVIGILIAAPTPKSRVIHIAYGLFITLLASGFVSYQHRVSDAERQLAEIKRVEHAAAALLSGFDFSTSGSMSGFMLAALSLLEKHRDSMPDTYTRAVALCERSGCLETNNGEYRASMEHFRNMHDASAALRYLVQGIAQGSQ